MKFSDWYPPNSPPDGADRAAGVVLRLLPVLPPMTSDFVPWIREEPPRGQAVPCERSGLSVFRSAFDINLVRNRVRSKRNHLVAALTLREEYGRTLATPKDQGPSHTTWWVPMSISPEALDWKQVSE